MPTSLKLTGKEETFIINVLYDTKDLYGKLTASRKVVVYRD